MAFAVSIFYMIRVNADTKYNDNTESLTDQRLPLVQLYDWDILRYKIFEDTGDEHWQHLPDFRKILPLYFRIVAPAPFLEGRRGLLVGAVSKRHPTTAFTGAWSGPPWK